LTPDTADQNAHDPLLDEATEWIARMRAADVTHADRAAFSKWLARSPAHRSAFDSMADLWDGLGAVTLRSEPLPALMAATAAARSPTSSWRWLAGIGALAATATVLVLALVLLLAPTTENTAPGERQQVELEDGSLLELNTRSRVRVGMGRTQRVLDVDVGSEIYLAVAGDSSRPFVIQTRHGTIEILGTELSVHVEEARTRVTVTRGQVEVSAKETDAALRHPVNAGQTLSISAGLLPGDPAASSIGQLEWRHGRLVYDQVTLQELITDLNRYLPKRMTLMAPELGRERLSAVLSLDHQESMLESLAAILPLRWVEVSDSLIIIHPG
jgi:transmembrane sensor